METPAFELLSRPIQQVLWDMQWRQLRPIQSDSIRKVLATDDDLLITARTASGKTEAAFLPILSRLFESPGASVGAMYVGPLKALINDQFQRLERLCEKAEIPVHRWHGDVDEGRKQKLLKNPGGVMLITPESLESFFVNRSSRLGGVFGDLRFVVIDEIHALVGKERGLQLRSQLYRLRRYTNGDFRLLGLSATVGDRVDFYRRWMRPENPGRVAHIEDHQESKRVQFGIYAYDVSLPQAETDEQTDDDDRLSDYDAAVPDELTTDVLRNFGGRKNLIFCNNRGGVEWLADGLNDACRRMGRPEEFLVHHGSVSKELRFSTEEEMRGPRPATAVCSSTLELGIDIGSVKTVGQLGSCWSVNSLVQRLGRSGRRDDEAHCMRIMLPIKTEVAEADLVRRLYPELLQSIALTELMLERWYEPPGVSEHDRSTLVQQVLSVLAEHGGAQAKALRTRLVSQGAFRETDLPTFTEVLRGLGRFGLIEQHDDLLILTPKGERLVHDRDFYSAFVTPQELTVRCEGRTIGSLSAIYMPRPEDHFLLAGRRWQVLEIDVQRAEILVRPAAGRKPPKFYGSSGEIHPRIHEEMLSAVSGTKSYAYLNARAKDFLSAARATYREATSKDDAVVDLGPGKCLWLTWAGTRVQRTLVLLAEQAGLECVDEKIAISFQCNGNDLIEALRGLIRNFLESDDCVFDLEPVPWRKFDEFVSQDLLFEAFLQDRLDLPGARAAIAKLVSSRPPPSVGAGVTVPPPQRNASDLSSSDELEADEEYAATFSVHAFSDGPLDSCRLVAFDLETTGLHPLWSQVIEIGAVRFDIDGRELDRFETLIDPGEPIPPDATAVHGITNAMVRGQPSIDVSLQRFADFVGSDDDVLLAHNAGFDREFLAVAGVRNRIALPSAAVVDTLTLARTLLPTAASYRLSSLVQPPNRSTGRPHRAAFDVDAVRLLFARLLGIRPIASRHELFELGAVTRLSDAPNSNAEVPEGYEQLASAIESRRKVILLYRGRALKARLLEVEPIGFSAAGGRTYLAALSDIDGKRKHYRLDRIQKLSICP